MINTDGGIRYRTPAMIHTGVTIGRRPLSEFRITHGERVIEIVTYGREKCVLNVDGHRVDSGVAPARGSTKLQDHESGVVVDVRYDGRVDPEVTLFADGRAIPVRPG